MVQRGLSNLYLLCVWLLGFLYDRDGFDRAGYQAGIFAVIHCLLKGAGKAFGEKVYDPHSHKVGLVGASYMVTPKSVIEKYVRLPYFSEFQTVAYRYFPSSLTRTIISVVVALLSAFAIRAGEK